MWYTIDINESEESTMIDREHAKELVREYEGQDLYKIGTHIPSRSCYNSNYYTLPNGVIVKLSNDDDGYNMVFVVDGNDWNATLVGEQMDGGEFYIVD